MCIPDCTIDNNLEPIASVEFYDVKLQDNQHLDVDVAINEALAS